MRRVTCIVFCLFFAACGEGERFSFSSTGGSSAGESDGGEVSIREISFQEDSTILLDTGEVKQLKLSVILSNAVAYSDVTDKFDGPGDSLDGSIAWFSNNEDVVQVSDEGILTAVGEGTTGIKATLGVKSAGLSIVVESKTVTLSALQFHDQLVEVSAWDPFVLTLDAAFSDGSSTDGASAETVMALADCDVVFSSVKKDVALITQEGEVWPVAEGNVAMKVECGGFRDAMTVRISGLPEREEAEEELVESIKVTVDSSNWVVGETRTLKAEVAFNTGTVSGVSTFFVTPSGNSGEVEWSSSDGGILAISEGKAELLAYGEAIVTARYQDYADAERVYVHMSPEDSTEDADRFLSDNDEFIIEYGTNGGYSSHLFPEIVYGMPQTGGTHVVSFGGGGYFLVVLNNYVVVDGPGVDFTVFENAIQSDMYGNFAERAQVYVSADDDDYFFFPCDDDDPDEIYSGCAGVTPVNAAENPLDPEVSGGDSFDLEDVGLAQAKYILIVDMDTCSPDDPTYYDLNGDALCGISGEQGFDLDAMAIINGVNE